jgi:hypothetical protein
MTELVWYSGIALDGISGNFHVADRTIGHGIMKVEMKKAFQL